MQLLSLWRAKSAIQLVKTRAAEPRQLAAARRGVLSGLLLAAAAAAGVLPGCHRDDASRPSTSDPAHSALGAASLTDQNGRVFKLADFAGQTVVLNFFFTSCPRICPVQTHALSEVQRALQGELRRRVHFVSLSVDPENDTPEALKKFAIENGADSSGWSFARASPAQTRAIVAQFEAIDPRAPAERASAHTINIFLLDASGRMMQRYAGSPVDVARLAREIEQLDGMARKDKG